MSTVLLCLDNPHCFFNVEGHGIQEEPHIPFGKPTVAHAGKPIVFLQDPHALFCPIAESADDSVDEALERGKRLPLGCFMHDCVFIAIGRKKQAILLACIALISTDGCTTVPYE